MFDLLIRGERVVTPHGVGPWEIGVKGGVIAALGAPGTLPQAGRVIDAGRGVVMPGAASAAITPSLTAISRASTPCGVTTRSPRITRSNMLSPHRPELRAGPAASRRRAPAR